VRALALLLALSLLLVWASPTLAQTTEPRLGARVSPSIVLMEPGAKTATTLLNRSTMPIVVRAATDLPSWTVRPARVTLAVGEEVTFTLKSKKKVPAWDTDLRLRLAPEAAQAGQVSTGLDLVVPLRTPEPVTPSPFTGPLVRLVWALVQAI
jgi:hypothetical protein